MYFYPNVNASQFASVLSNDIGAFREVEDAAVLKRRVIPCGSGGFPKENGGVSRQGRVAFAVGKYVCGRRLKELFEKSSSLLAGSETLKNFPDAVV